MPLPALVLGAAVTPTTTPTPTPTPGLTGASPDHADLILWLTVGGIIVAGCVIVVGRSLLVKGQDGAATNLIRSWIAISLVIGLMVFCAASLTGDNSSLQSRCSAGSSSAPEPPSRPLSSRQADQARAEILSAASLGQGQAKPTKFSGPVPPDGKEGEASLCLHRGRVPAPVYFVAGEGFLPTSFSIPTGHRPARRSRQALSFQVIAANSAGFLVSPDFKINISPD